jgi:hypothetical protein
MKIIDYRPTPHGEGNTIAMLDAEVAPGIRMFGMRLLRMPDGSHRVYGTQAALDREVVAAIAKAVLSHGGDRLESNR